MNFLRGGLIAGLSLASVALGSTSVLAATPSAGAPDGTPQLLTELQFTSASSAGTNAAIAAVAQNAAGWTFAAQHGGSISVQATQGPAGDTVYALEGSYPAPPSGGEYIDADYDVSNLNTEDIYIEFWAKMPGVKEGCKFVKIFGKRITPANPTNYADTTFLADYTGANYGALRQVSFGDGTTLVNDTQNAINLDGTNPQGIGRSYGTAVVNTPQMSTFSSQDWGTGWHHFWIHVKFNGGTTSQNEVPNGEVYLKIDNKVYVDATGLYNRNPANEPIDYIGFFGWAQTELQAFQLWYYDVRISTGGFMSQTLPDPPTNVAAQ